MKTTCTVCKLEKALDFFPIQTTTIVNEAQPLICETCLLDNTGGQPC